jgi:hypothetical protein
MGLSAEELFIAHVLTFPDFLLSLREARQFISLGGAHAGAHKREGAHMPGAPIPKCYPANRCASEPVIWLLNATAGQSCGWRAGCAISKSGLECRLEHAQLAKKHRWANVSSTGSVILYSIAVYLNHNFLLFSLLCI